MHFSLSENDKTLLQRMLDRERNRVLNTRQRPDPWPQDWQATDVYVAIAPLSPGSGTGTGSLQEEGIPPIVGMSPGVAEGCTIYQLIKSSTVPYGTLQPLSSGLVQTVYNLGPKIDQGQPFLVARDKFGQWYAIQSPVEGSETGGAQVGSPHPLNVTTIGDQVSVGNFKYTTILFDATASDAMTETTTTDGKLTAPVAGLYLATVNLQVNTGFIGGWFQVFFTNNGVGQLDEMTVALSAAVNPNNNNGQAGLSTLVNMTAGEYVQVGANLFLNSTPAGQTWAGLFSLVKVGE
jgi:hypothetical protein